MSSFSTQLAAILEPGPFPGKAAQAYRLVSSAAAVIVTGVRLAATVEGFWSANEQIALDLEAGAVAILTLDLFLHGTWAVLAASQSKNSGGKSPARALLSYFMTLWGVIDLVSVLPFFLVRFIPFPADLNTALGLVPFLKVARYSPALDTLGSVLRRESRPLRAAMFILILGIMVSSTVLYLAERNINPAAFGSIPEAMWWSVVTLTTLGYGDAVPVSPLGKVLGGVVAVLGIGMFALPASILATGFAEEVKRRDFLHTWHMVAKVPFFHSLDADQIASITGLLRFLTAAPGDVLIRVGDVGDRMYFIISGAVTVDFGSGRKTLLEDGDFFGEIALLRSSPRTATVSARSRCQLLALDVKDFRHFLAGSPEIAKAIAETAQARLDAQS